MDNKEIIFYFRNWGFGFVLLFSSLFTILFSPQYWKSAGEAELVIGVCFFIWTYIFCLVEKK